MFQFARLTAALLVAGVTLAPSAGAQESTPEAATKLQGNYCLAAYKVWRKKAPLHRAFAATPPAARQNCGYSYGWGSVDQAAAAALAYCDAVRPRVKGACILVQVE
jgi:hypothetical protein